MESIRKKEKIYHETLYREQKLYAPGSWLSRPADNVMYGLSHVDTSRAVRILDLGCGGGRHAVKTAEVIHEGSVIDCVDILGSAVDILNQNAKMYNVAEKINGRVGEIDDFFTGSTHQYDYIIAVSVLEHVKDVPTLYKVIKLMRKHLNDNGVICMIINTSITETNQKSAQKYTPQFEVNLETEEVLDALNTIFKEFTVLKTEVKSLKYNIKREDRDIELKTEALTFIIKRTTNEEANIE